MEAYSLSLSSSTATRSTPNASLKTLALPLTLRRDADDAFIQRVGVVKVEERISFADAFALALAERLNIPLVTTDHHKFDAIERKGHFRFMWLR